MHRSHIIDTPQTLRDDPRWSTVNVFCLGFTRGFPRGFARGFAPIRLRVGLCVAQRALTRCQYADGDDAIWAGPRWAALASEQLTPAHSEMET